MLALAHVLASMGADSGAGSDSGSRVALADSDAYRRAVLVAQGSSRDDPARAAPADRLLDLDPCRVAAVHVVSSDLPDAFMEPLGLGAGEDQCDAIATDGAPEQRKVLSKIVRASRAYPVA